MMRMPVSRAESGASLVEFAVFAPLFAFLLVGLIEIGRFMFFSILAANAARAGAQYGAQDLTTAFDTSGITNSALQDGQNLSNWTAPGGGITVQQLCVVNGAAPQPCATSGTAGPPQNTIYYVNVHVTGVFETLLNYPGIPNNVPISGSSMMRVITQ
jgi:Flp pilus assembly protein TadG